MKILQNHDNFKLLFIDIAKGSSFSPTENLYIRHSADYDLAELIQKKEIYIAEEFSGPLSLSEESKLKLLKEHGLWGDKEEDDRLSLEMTISTNKTLVEKMSVPSQKETINAIILQKEQELSVIQEKKDELIGYTEAHYSSKFMSELIISSSYFKDRECKTLAFSDEEFELLKDERISSLNESYTAFLNRFSQRAMRSLACLPFFLNQLSYARKNLSVFFGCPIVKFSHFQMDIVSKGLRNLNVLENAESDPPDIEEHTEVQEIMDWYDVNYSIMVGKRKSNSDTIGVTKSKNYVKAR